METHELFCKKNSSSLLFLNHVVSAYMFQEDGTDAAGFFFFFMVSALPNTYFHTLAWSKICSHPR